MATDDLTLRMRAVGARGAAKDVDRTTGSVKRLDKATDRAGRSMRRSSGSVRLFSSGLRPVARIATSAGAALGVLGLAGAARAAVGEFRESQKVGNQTAAVLRSIGAGSWISSAQVGALANSISLKTGIDDEAIQSGSNLLLTFKAIRNEVGKGNDIFNRATQAAVDLSAAGFGSMSSTAKQLGKALNDPIKGITALNRSGVQFTQVQKDTIKTLVETGDILGAQKIILGEVEAQVKGSAAAQADSIDLGTVAYKNMLEVLGGQLWPVIGRAARAFAGLMIGIQDNTGAGGQLRGVVVGVAHALEDVWGFAKRNQAVLLSLTAAVLGGVAAYKTFLVISTVARVLQTGLVFLTMWRMGTLQMTAAQWGLNTALLANPIALAVIALVAIGAGLYVAYQRSESFRNAVDGLWGSLRGVAGFIGGALVTGINLFIRSINLAISAINLLIRAHNLLPGKDAPLVGKVGLLGGGLGDRKDEKRTLGGPSGTGHLARGGLVKRTGVFEVGERGRETVALPAGTSVQPHGGGGDIIVHSYLTLDGKVAAQSTQRQAIRKLATR